MAIEAALCEEWEHCVVGMTKMISYELRCLGPWQSVCLVLSNEYSCYRSRRTGGKGHKAVHACIVDANLSHLSDFITKKRRQGCL